MPFLSWKHSIEVQVAHSFSIFPVSWNFRATYFVKRRCNFVSKLHKSPAHGSFRPTTKNTTFPAFTLFRLFFRVEPVPGWKRTNKQFFNFLPTNKNWIVTQRCDFFAKCDPSKNNPNLKCGLFYSFSFFNMFIKFSLNDKLSCSERKQHFVEYAIKRTHRWSFGKKRQSHRGFD